MVYLEIIRTQCSSLVSNLKYLKKSQTYFWFTSLAASSDTLLFAFSCRCLFFFCSFYLFISPSLPLFILTLLSPLPPAADLSPLSLYFLPLPPSAWLRCEIILLLGGFPAICHCHLLALRLEGGSLFQKHTALRFTTLCIINSWARDWRGVHQRSSMFYWAWQGNT